MSHEFAIGIGFILVGVANSDPDAATTKTKTPLLHFGVSEALCYPEPVWYRLYRLESKEDREAPTKSTCLIEIDVCVILIPENRAHKAQFLDIEQTMVKGAQ